MTASTQAGPTIKVLTFNLRTSAANDGANNWQNANQNPDRRQVALSVITSRLPDVIGFQEGEDVQLDYLAANLPASYAWHRQKPSGGGPTEQAAFAFNTNVLALVDRGVFSLGPSPGEGYVNNPPGTAFDPYKFLANMGFAFPRLALWGRFRLLATGQEFLFYTTHFDVNRASDGPQVRSARLIVDDSRARNDRMPLAPLAIVVGDFNCSRADPAWKLFTGAGTFDGITGDFTDSWWQAHGAWLNSGTIHGFNGGLLPENDRIDWILHRGGFTTLQCDIVTDSALATVFSPPGTRTQYPSDHYPVYAVLQFPKQQTAGTREN